MVSSDVISDEVDENGVPDSAHIIEPCIKDEEAVAMDTTRLTPLSSLVQAPL